MPQATNVTSRATFQLTYALNKQVPDMQQRGVRIETSYGELELDEHDSQQVAALVKVLIENKLERIQRVAA